MKVHQGKVAGVLSGIFLLAAGVGAEEYAFVGARASGMAGANAASVRDATAMWHNPAAFGFFGRSEWETNAVDNGNLAKQKFSWELFGFGVGYTLTEDMGRYLDILADIDFDDFDSGTLSNNAENVSSLLSMAGIVGNLDAGDALYVDTSLGSSVQIGHFGIGLRMFGSAAAYALPDIENLALEGYASTNELVAELDGAATTEGFSGGSYVISTLTPSQQTDLATTLGVAPGSDTIKYLDYKLGELVASGDLTADEIDGAVDLFANLVPGVGGSISNNLTSVVGRGFSLVEIPVSYGWAMNENLSFGVTAKAMYGSVLGTKIWVFNEDNDQVFEDISDSREDSLTLGIDLGVLYRIPNFQFALVGHNLNRPTFDGFTDTINYSINGGATQTETLVIPDVKIDPQLTVGAAYMPSKRMAFEVDLELLETGTLLNGYDIQRLSFGGEFDVWLLALRLGAYDNLAESGSDWVATAGIGCNLFGLRVDVSGAYSLDDKVEYDGNDVPSEARLFASVGLDF